MNSIPFFIALALIACSPKPKPSAPAADDKVNGQEVTQADGRRVAEHLIPFDAEDPRAWRVYFAFNSTTLQGTNMLAAIARQMKRTGERIALTGNASTEGTNEYNFALGARRAEAVRAYLVAAGVRPTQITTKSLGEEAPVALEPENEHLNRRVDAILEAIP